jgi:pyruvate/2-oxoglutarate/acetoin dehydrogenase E1 component
LIQAIRDGDPVIYVEHRILHFQKGLVPESEYVVPAGKARVLAQGKHITLIGISYMVLECLRARDYLASTGIDAEVIDPVWLSPLDIATIVQSARKTGRLCVVDNGWTACGVGAEIVSQVIERVQNDRHVAVHRLGYAPVTCPPTPVLEDLYYPNARTIASTAYDLVKGGKNDWLPQERKDLAEFEFRGPF